MPWDWKPIDTAPKDGRDILICMPGGQSDHYYPVCWDDETGSWTCRYGDLVTLRDSEEVQDNAKNRAIWAYLAETPPDWPIVLYWH